MYKLHILIHNNHNNNKNLTKFLNNYYCILINLKKIKMIVIKFKEIFFRSIAYKMMAKMI